MNIQNMTSFRTEDLIKSINGNLIFQELSRKLNEGQRKLLWQTIKSKLIELLNTKQGSVFLHILIDLAISIKEQNEIWSYFQPHISKLSCDKQGNLILQKILLNFPDLSKKDLLAYVWDNASRLIFDSQGVCLVKSYVIFLKEKSSRHKSDFLHLIMKVIQHVIVDKNGHLFILCLVDQWRPKDYKPIIDFLKSNLVECAVHKYAFKILMKILKSTNKVSSLN